MPASRAAVALLVVAVPPAAVVAKLQPNPPNQPTELNATGLIPCAGRNLCSVLLDVPAACVTAGASQCPIGFFFHGHGDYNTEFLVGRQRNIRFGGVSGGVHANSFIGVYPQGAMYSGTNRFAGWKWRNKTPPASGWNDGSMPGDRCAWDDYDCHEDPNDGTFIAGIIDALRKMGAGGHIYLWGGSNGAMAVQVLASNAGPKLPVAAISAGWGELNAKPPRSGPSPYNWNQPTPRPDQQLPGRVGDGRPVAQQAHHGDQDPVVPWSGGPRFNSTVWVFMSEHDSDHTWARHNGCKGALTQPRNYSAKFISRAPATKGTVVPTTAIYWRYEGCPATAPVEYYQIVGCPHGGAFEIDGRDPFWIVFSFWLRVEKALHVQ